MIEEKEEETSCTLTEEQKKAYENIDSNLVKILVQPDQSGYTNISHGQWKQLHMTEYIEQKKLTECLVSKKLYLGNNGEERIIPLIKNIKFPYLKEINIWGNHIESIEGLSCVFFPCLVNFAINGNLLREVRSLRKCNWPKIKSLGLSMNKFLQLSSLTQMYFPEIDRMVLAFHSDWHMCEDSSWLAKIQGSLQSLYTMSIMKIDQQSLMSCLQRKNPLLSTRK